MATTKIYASIIFMLIYISAIFFISCKSDETSYQTPNIVVNDEELSGGDATTYDQSSNAFGHEVAGLTSQQSTDFIVGNSFFRNNWVLAPASTTGRDGLGPMINAASCSACHFKDGRGQLPVNGEQPIGLLLKLSQNSTDVHGLQIGDPIYGGQFNNATVIGVDKEGDVDITYQEIKGNFDDGEEYTLRKPIITVSNLKYGSLSADTKISPRLSRQLPGLGLLEAISETDILALSDENDANNDGISGRANYVWDYINNKTSLGRFGWKASQPSIKQFVAEAFRIDIGITSSIFLNENITPYQLSLYPDFPSGGTPEISDEILNQVSLYTAALAVPSRRNLTNTEVIEGKKLFVGAGCYKCHNPAITTGVHPSITALTNQKIKPYTDMLLHDMGEGLADEKEEYLAKGNEWRTPPLWGIGLTKTVIGQLNLLHDGRAQTFSEAILWHGGEAEKAKNIYKSMTKAQRNALVKFLESL